LSPDAYPYHFPLLLPRSSAPSLSAATWKYPALRCPRPRSWPRSASPGPRCAESYSIARQHLPVAGPDSTAATWTSAAMASNLVASLVHLLRTGNGQQWGRASESGDAGGDLWCGGRRPCRAEGRRICCGSNFSLGVNGDPPPPPTLPGMGTCGAAVVEG
jgi:hypothetical protein